MSTKLLVIITDRLSELMEKGEVVDRYYNPGELFDEVHILMTNNDRPDPEAAKRLVGRASLFFHNLPFGKGDFALTLGMRPALMTRWALPGVAIAERIRPGLIRCHGASANSYVALAAKLRLGIPYVVSMHSHPGEVRSGLSLSFKERLVFTLGARIERLALSGANAVICVYEYLREYVRKMGAKRIEVIHNVINREHLRVKEGYGLKGPARLISVGRQMVGKDPSPIIAALAHIPDATLTLVGSGPLYHRLIDLARSLGLAQRVEFITRIPNNELVAMLADFDVFVAVNRYGGISKAVLEALLTGLPVVHSRHPSHVPEFLGEAGLLVEETKEGFEVALREVLGDGALREKMGARGLSVVEPASPAYTEARLTALYEELRLKSQGAKKEI